MDYMQSIGTILSQARKKKKMSRARLSQHTKIKEEFLEALENEQWGELPPLTTTTGFVRSIATALDIAIEPVLALLRREFPPEVPKQIPRYRIVWKPQFTSLLIGILIMAAIGSYLLYQYRVFVAPPSLEVTVARENGTTTVHGTTSQNATVLVNGEPALVDNKGIFSISISTQPGQPITIEAVSRSGKSTKKELPAP